METILAALEITKQGVWAAENFAQLKFPLFNVAQTRIKAIEGNLVGDAVVSSIDMLLREIGISLFDSSFSPGIYTLSEGEEMGIANSWLQLRELPDTHT